MSKMSKKGKNELFLIGYRRRPQTKSNHTKTLSVKRKQQAFIEMSDKATKPKRTRAGAKAKVEAPDPNVLSEARARDVSRWAGCLPGPVIQSEAVASEAVASESIAKVKSEKKERVLCNELCPYCPRYSDARLNTRYRYRHLLDKHLLKCESKKRHDEEQAELADIMERIVDPATQQIDAAYVARFILDERKRVRELEQELHELKHGTGGYESDGWWEQEK
jgi:hypothetical protein